MSKISRSPHWVCVVIYTLASYLLGWIKGCRSHFATFLGSTLNLTLRIVANLLAAIFRPLSSNLLSTGYFGGFSHRQHRTHLQKSHLFPSFHFPLRIEDLGNCISDFLSKPYPVFVQTCVITNDFQ
jgi:hypothetical protein